MFIHRIEINRAIAVIAGRRLAVVDLFLVGPVGVVIPGIQPQRRDAEVFQIRQAIDDAAQVAAVIVTAFAAIKQAPGFRRVVVRRVAVAETVGHDEVQHIIRRETLKAALP